MKLPLLVEAKPKIAVGPTVMLLQGSWIIEADLVDSIVNIHPDNLALLPLTNGQTLNIEYDARCSVNIIKPGTEQSITIYAKKVE